MSSDVLILDYDLVLIRTSRDFQVISSLKRSKKESQCSEWLSKINVSLILNFFFWLRTPFPRFLGARGSLTDMVCPKSYLLIGTNFRGVGCRNPNQPDYPLGRKSLQSRKIVA